VELILSIPAHEENINYFNMCNAYETIKEWFDKQDGNYKIIFLQTLLNYGEKKI